MHPTDTRDPQYYHRVVDCQWACPAHTNVPEYIRLIADGKYTESYMLNRESNVFPGILGRTCDRPCEPACRRTRVEDEPVAICRLKRVAADLRGEIDHLLPKAAAEKNGKRIALIGAGPAHCQATGAKPDGVQGFHIPLTYAKMILMESSIHLHIDKYQLRRRSLFLPFTKRLS